MSSEASHRNFKLHQPENFRFDSVPDSHDWTDLHDHPFVDLIDSDCIPVIDLNDPNLIEKIGKACEEWGVFLITNHGIEPKLLDAFSSQVRRLFALPTEVKLQVAKTDGRMPGYGGIAASKFFPKLTWSEGFSIGGSPLDHAQKFWPDDYSSYCEVIEEYRKAMKPLGCRLLQPMLRSLGFSEEEINLTPIGDSNKISTLMQLNSYPACPDPNRALGLVPHTDTDMITILHDNGVSGLQVLKREDDIGPTRWVTVPIVPDTFVVNVGDFMHIYSNGRFHNVPHRVVVNTSNQRLSAASVFVLPMDEKVEPLSKLTGPKQDPMYKSVTWMEYFKLRDRLYVKALEAIKISEE